MSKWFLLIYLILLFSIGAFAQRQNVYFLKDSGKQVTTRDSADYIRIISEPVAGSVLYNLKEYYSSGVAKCLAQVSTINPLRFEGQCIAYFKSGSRQRVIFYKNGIVSGD